MAACISRTVELLFLLKKPKHPPIVGPCHWCWLSVLSVPAMQSHRQECAECVVSGWSHRQAVPLSCVLLNCARECHACFGTLSLRETGGMQLRSVLSCGTKS